MEIVKGLDKHPMLARYVEKARQRLVPGDEEEAAVALRKACEKMVEEYVKQYPNCYDPSLFVRITNLEELDVLSEEERDLFHTLRKTGNAGGAHAGDTAPLSELQALYERLLQYLPAFLEKFPTPGKASPRMYEGQPVSPLLDMQIDYDEIQPLLLNVPDPPRMFGIAELEKENDRYIGEAMVYPEYEQCKWIKEIDKYTFSKDGRMYLDRKRMMRDYEKIIKEDWADTDNWAERIRTVDGDVYHLYRPGRVEYVPFILQEFTGYLSVAWDPGKNCVNWYEGQGSENDHCAYWTGYLYDAEFEEYPSDINGFAQKIKEIYQPPTYTQVTYNGDLKKKGVYLSPVLPDWVLKFARHYGYDTVRRHDNDDLVWFLNVIQKKIGEKPSTAILYREFAQPQQPQQPQAPVQPQAPARPQSPARPQNAAQTQNAARPQQGARVQPAPAQPVSPQGTAQPAGGKGKEEGKAVKIVGLVLMLYGAVSFVATLLQAIFGTKSLAAGIFDIVLSAALAYFGYKLLSKDQKTGQNKR